MTYSNAHNQRRVAPWLTPEDDDLDHFLNTNVASDGPPDADALTDPESLIATADEFHTRMETAQEQYPRAARPDPDLWDRILGEQDNKEKEPDMSSTPLALDNRPTRIQPVSPTLPKSKPGRIDISRWANAIAAAVLIVAIGAGYWFSGYGPGGRGQGGDPPRYAALGVTPAASPEISTVGCNVEPLTTDEVMAIVKNPLNRLDAMGVKLEASPEPLLEVSWSASYGLPQDVEMPSETEFTAIQETASNYFSCLEFGTNYQIWSLTSPYAVQTEILAQFPVLRDEEAIREWVDGVGPQSHVTAIQGIDIYSEYNERGYQVEPNPNRADALVVGEGWEPWSAWIGTQLVSEDDQTVIASTGARPGTVILNGRDSNERPPEILVLAKWGNTSMWLVQGKLSLIG